MRNLYFYLLLVFVLTGCSKGSSNNPTPNNSKDINVDYEFIATTTGTYIINYTDAYGYLKADTIKGTSWSKKFKLLTDFPAVHTGFSGANKDNINSSVTGLIYINNQLKSKNSVDFTYNNLQSIYCFYDFVQ